jgi:hypothetical protein
VASFGNPIVAGITLIRKAIQSKNYVAGSAGWVVKAAGDAEFNNVTIRGELTATPSALSTDPIIASRPVGSTFDMFDVNAGGTMLWGGGLGPADVQLNRNGAGQLEIAPSLLVNGTLVTVDTHVTGNLNVDGNENLTGNLSVSGIGQTQFVRKSANQNRTNNNTLINDTELLLPVAANAVYEFTGHIIFQASGAAAVSGYKATFAVPAAATLDWVWHGKIDTDGTQTAITIWQNALTAGVTINSGGAGIGTPLVAKPSGLLVTGANAGNLQFQFAQATANATASVTNAGSFLILRRIA